MDIEGIEKACSEVCDDNINMMIPWYIMAAYAYYVDDNPIMHDNTFDKLAKRILDHWDEIDHYHKDLLTKDMLTAGTFLGEYPSRVKGAVDEIRHAYKR
jgi:NAD-dependent DNA ligase